MDRPKRELKKINIDPIMSDLELDESDGDFSSESSDEYDPNKTQSSSSDEEIEEEISHPQRPSIKKACAATLRQEAISKLKDSAQKFQTNFKLQSILNKARFRQKNIFDNRNDSDVIANNSNSYVDVDSNIWKNQKEKEMNYIEVLKKYEYIEQ